jgi:hypothetical protein
MSDFKRMRIKGVELKWPKLDQLYRYDPTFKREDGGRGKSVPAQADEERAEWSVTMSLPEKRGKALFAKCKEHFETRKPGEEFGGVWGYKELNGDDLILDYTASKKAKNSKGKYNEQPEVLDANDQPLANRSIYSGSTGDVYFAIFTAFNPSERKEGISIILDKVIVTNPIYGGGDYDDLDDEAPAPKSKSSSTEYDDEIPF